MVLRWHSRNTEPSKQVRLPLSRGNNFGQLFDSIDVDIDVYVHPYGNGLTLVDLVFIGNCGLEPLTLNLP